MIESWMAPLSDVWTTYWVVMGALLGASTGSFSGVVLERMPRGESLGGRSHCACGRQLRNRENLPILGWLLAGGKARCCGASLPVWYLGLEIGMFSVFTLAALLGGWRALAAVAGASLAVVFGTAIVGRRRAAGPDGA